MATIIPYKDKQGNIVSYQIQVYKGRDADGKKLKPYTMSWKVPEGWKDSSIERELNKVAAQFEIDCKEGLVSTKRKTFSQYAEYVMQLKERDNKHRTVQRYKQLLTRINEEIGHLAYRYYRRTFKPYVYEMVSKAKTKLLGRTKKKEAV